MLGTGHWQLAPVDPFAAVSSHGKLDAFAANLSRAAADFNLSGYNIDWENGWAINATCGAECAASVLSRFIGATSRSLRRDGRTISLCVDAGDPLCNWTTSAYGPCGYLDRGAIPQYAAAGVDRVQQMGTYPLKPPFTMARQLQMLDAVVAAAGGGDRVGIGLSYRAHGGDGGGLAWTAERLRTFLRAVRRRGVREIDMFTGRGVPLDLPAWWWAELESFRETERAALL